MVGCLRILLMLDFDEKGCIIPMDVELSTTVCLVVNLLDYVIIV